jgi:hypothetical protein
MSKDMEDEYDFSGGERGKFYRPGGTVRLPVYLDEQVQSYLAAAAQRKGTSLSEIVNELLRHEIAITEELK